MFLKTTFTIRKFVQTYSDDAHKLGDESFEVKNKSWFFTLNHGLGNVAKVLQRYVRQT